MSAEMNEYDHHGWAEAVRLTRKVVGRRVEGAKVIGFLEALVAVVVGLKPALLFEAAALEAEELHALALEIVGVLFPRTHNTNITASALACLVLGPATDPTAAVDDDDAAFWGPGTLFLADLSQLVPRLEKQLHHLLRAGEGAASWCIGRTCRGARGGRRSGQHVAVCGGGMAVGLPHTLLSALSRARGTWRKRWRW